MLLRLERCVYHNTKIIWDFLWQFAPYSTVDCPLQDIRDLYSLSTSILPLSLTMFLKSHLQLCCFCQSIHWNNGWWIFYFFFHQTLNIPDAYADDRFDPAVSTQFNDLLLYIRKWASSTAVLTVRSGLKLVFLWMPSIFVGWSSFRILYQNHFVHANQKWVWRDHWWDTLITRLRLLSCLRVGRLRFKPILQHLNACLKAGSSNIL